MDNQIRQVWQTPSGKIFNTYEEAHSFHCGQIKNQILSKITDLMFKYEVCLKDLERYLKYGW